MFPAKGSLCSLLSRLVLREMGSRKGTEDRRAPSGLQVSKRQVQDATGSYRAVPGRMSGRVQVDLPFSVGFGRLCTPVSGSAWVPSTARLCEGAFCHPAWSEAMRCHRAMLIVSASHAL